MSRPEGPGRTLVAIEDVDVRFGRASVLQAVSLRVERGEIVTVVGPNGSGKSTLLRVLIGAERPARGRVLRAAGLRVGYVPQKLHVDRTLPLTARRFLDLPRAAGSGLALEALRRAGAEGLEERQMADLSGGQLQRVLLARAVLHRPDLLLLDEPTQGLDQPGSAAFYRDLARIRDELGCAVVLVSHDLHVVMAASDRVVCLNGHVCCEGTPQAVSAAPAYRQLFGSGTGGALALYRHEHAHSHDHGGHHHGHSHGHDHARDHARREDA